MADSKDDTDEKEKLSEKGFNREADNQYFAGIRFELPIYIPIPDGVYKVYANSMVADVKLRRIDKLTPISKSVKTSKNVFNYVPDLRYDPFNSTKVTIEFRPSGNILRKFKDSKRFDNDPYTDGPINPILEESLLFVNKIVRAYQYYSGNVAIGRIQTWDIGTVQILLRPYPKGSSGTSKLISCIGYSRPIIHTTSPTDDEVLVQIIDKVKKDWSVSVHTRLLLTARYLYLMGEFSAAVITAQSALELFLSRRLENHLKHITIRIKGKEKQIPLKRAGLRCMIMKGLKQAIGKNLSDIDSSLNQHVTKARKLRNDIIHEGIDATMVDADICIKTFSRTIDKLDSEV